MAAHPLDRAIWNALSTRQAALSQGDGMARRLDPAIGPLAAAADASPEAQRALATLAGADEVWLIEREDFPLPPSLRIARQAPILQMLAKAQGPAPTRLEIVPLGEADGPAMLALATRTQPGPFGAGTWRYGGFLGVKEGDQLVAMAGERMRPPGFTEVSGVCTLPEHRGRGLAADLMRAVAANISARGDQPFLTVYASNTRAIALYETLGYRARAALTLSVLAGGQAA